MMNGSYLLSKKGSKQLEESRLEFHRIGLSERTEKNFPQLTEFKEKCETDLNAIALEAIAMWYLERAYLIREFGNKLTNEDSIFSLEELKEQFGSGASIEDLVNVLIPNYDDKSIRIIKGIWMYVFDVVGTNSDNKVMYKLQYRGSIF